MVPMEPYMRVVSRLFSCAEYFIVVVEAKRQEMLWTAFAPNLVIACDARRHC